MILINEKTEVFESLNEAIDALGDIPAENATEQQKKAYRECKAARDRLLESNKNEH